MSTKNTTGKKPKVGNLNELDIATNETDTPVPYFAGVARLSGTALMQAVISRTKPSGQTGKK